MLVERAEPDDKEQIDRSLDTEPEYSSTKMIEKTLSDGRVIQISEARLARIRANTAGIQKMNPRKA